MLALAARMKLVDFVPHAPGGALAAGTCRQGRAVIRACSSS